MVSLLPISPSAETPSEKSPDEKASAVWLLSAEILVWSALLLFVSVGFCSLILEKSPVPSEKVLAFTDVVLVILGI